MNQFNLEEKIKDILTRGDNSNTYVDVGIKNDTIIKIASDLGYMIKAYDEDKTRLQNLADSNSYVKTWPMVFNDETIAKKWCEACSIQKKIELIKIDLYGNEHNAFRYFEACIGVTNNLIIVMYPRIDYAPLAAKIISSGFEASYFDSTGQSFIWFKK